MNAIFRQQSDTSALADRKKPRPKGTSDGAKVRVKGTQKVLDVLETVKSYREPVGLATFKIRSMSAIAMFQQLLPLIRKRIPYLVEKSGFAGRQVAEIRACFGEAQSTVRSAAHFIRIVFILTVVFPEADRTDFVVPSTVQGLEPAARASI
jgi:hypothetical protein